MSTSFTIATRNFAKKRGAVAFFKEMLNRYHPKDRVNAADARDLASLLERHTEYSAKKGVGIDHFRVMRNRFGTRSFKIVRIDGTRDDFS